MAGVTLSSKTKMGDWVLTNSGLIKPSKSFKTHFNCDMDLTRSFTRIVMMSPCSKLELVNIGSLLDLDEI